MTMTIAHAIDELRAWRRAQAPARVGFVPTMGALHEGHLSLMHEARARAERLVVSIFVNPMQFAPHEDFERYPRPFAADQAVLAEAGVDCLFYPTPEIVYPPGFRTFVEVEEWGGRLEGQTRPSHFRGVTTVVLKLLNLVQPDVAVFGWKDAQQFIILRRMVEDLNLPVEMAGGEIVREADGLAMSSRNRYLSARQRLEATVLHRALSMARSMALERDVRRASTIVRNVRQLIESESSGRVDYVSIDSLQTLQPLDEVRLGETLLSLAVYFDETRLLDNLRL